MERGEEQFLRGALLRYPRGFFAGQWRGGEGRRVKRGGKDKEERNGRLRRKRKRR